MSFMRTQTTKRLSWAKVETTEGTEYVPLDVVGRVDGLNAEQLCEAVADYCEGAPRDVEFVDGYGVRLSAPGYLDCTPWAVFETEAEADQAAAEWSEEAEAEEAEES